MRGWRRHIGWASLGLLVALALAMRFAPIASDPIWFDEAATVGIASMSWSTIFGPMQAAESSPPGYYALAKLWSQLFGDGIAGLRLLSVLAGAAVLVPVWWLARAVAGGAAALVAPGFVALAATHIRLSQDARCYALLVLGAGVAMLLAVRLATDLRAGRRPWGVALAYGTLIGALLWLHATATLVGLAVNVFALALLWPQPRLMRTGLAWLAGANIVAVAIGWSPLDAMLAHVVEAPRYGDRWLTAPGLIDAARIYSRAVVAPNAGDFSPWSALLQLTLMAAAALAWWRSGNPLLLALAVMLTVGGLALPLVSQFRPVMMDRTVLFLLLPMAVLLAAGVDALPRRWGAIAAVALLGIQAVGAWNWHHWPVRKEQWDEAAVTLHARRAAGEQVIMPDGAFAGISLARHLTKIGAPVPKFLVVPPDSPLERLAAAELAPGHPADLDALCRHLAGGVGTVWLVMRDHPEVVDVDRGFSMSAPIRERFEASGGRVLERVRLIGVDLERWKVRPCTGLGRQAGDRGPGG